MEKIVYSQESVKKVLIEECKDKVFLTGGETRKEIIVLIEDYNSKIESLEKEVESYVPKSGDGIILSSPIIKEKTIFSEAEMTAQQYLNSKSASSRTKFFISKKYGLGSRPKDEWENIFREEKL